MSRRNPKGREINGIVLLDKDIGLSSNAALQKVKRLFFAKKAGHTGALDPLASVRSLMRLKKYLLRQATQALS